jgi:DNA-binding PadR family transcriptional regulator
MPRKNAMTKPVRSFRISAEGVRQLRELSEDMGRSESEVIEVAVDRMYREEIRFGNLSVAEKTKPEDNYQVDLEEGK